MMDGQKLLFRISIPAIRHSDRRSTATITSHLLTSVMPSGALPRSETMVGQKHLFRAHLEAQTHESKEVKVCVI